MGGEQKPYRVYRGRRTRARAPAFPKRKGTPDLASIRRQARRRPRSRRRQALRWIGIGLTVFLLWLAAWSLAGYFSFRDGVKAANKRLPASARHVLSKQDGLLLTSPTNVLLIGTDHADIRSRAGVRHSDSLMLVRSDPDHHRIYYLSIPRDLYVEIPVHSPGRITTSYQIGGAALTVQTVRRLTGLDVNHVAVVDFSRFKQLIDDLGGIDINVPRRIQSDRFDCPYKTQARCASWQGWRFAKGKQHMDGRRALIYSRVRVNKLNAADNDITRAERQQQVLQAIAAKLASIGTFLGLPFNGGDLLKPLATDLSAGDFLQLGWVKFRSGNNRAVHCRLGGDPESIGGASVIRSSDLNRNVISMFTGESAPQPPPPGTGTFGPGCVTGKHTLGSR